MKDNELVPIAETLGEDASHPLTINSDNIADVIFRLRLKLEGKKLLDLGHVDSKPITERHELA